MHPFHSAVNSRPRSPSHSRARHFMSSQVFWPKRRFLPVDECGPAGIRWEGEGPGARGRWADALGWVRHSHKLLVPQNAAQYSTSTLTELPTARPCSTEGTEVRGKEPALKELWVRRRNCQEKSKGNHRGERACQGPEGRMAQTGDIEAQWGSSGWVPGIRILLNAHQGYWCADRFRDRSASGRWGRQHRRRDHMCGGRKAVPGHAGKG